MKSIRFYKDGSKRIKLGNEIYKPYTLEQILNVPSMFYKVFEDAENEEDEVSEGITQWFNYKGLTYVKQQ